MNRPERRRAERAARKTLQRALEPEMPEGLARAGFVIARPKILRPPAQVRDATKETR